MVVRTRLAPAALALSLLAGCGAGAEGTKGDDSVASAAATDTATTTVSAPSSSPPSETTSENPASSTSASTSASTTVTDEDIRDLRRAIDKALEDSPLTFATRSAELGKEVKKALREIAEAAARHESPTLIVTTTAGYRDDDKAKKLSEQRAAAIAGELVADDVAEDRIEIKALGNGGDSDNPDDSGTGVYAKITVAEE